MTWLTPFLLGFVSAIDYPAVADLRHEIVGPGSGKVIDEYLERLTGFGWSGAVLVIKDRKVVLNKAYGYADRIRRIPNRVDTLFEIASLGKQFTAAAILKLESEGKLSVKEPLGKYLPGATPAYAGLPLELILRHRAGVPGAFDLFEVLDKKSALDRILKKKPSFGPNVQFEYSNTGYTLLAAVVEAVSGRRFQDLLRDKIFHPNGMLKTGFFGKFMPPAGRNDVALGYDEVKVRLNPFLAEGNNWTGLGAGEVMSNLPDMYRWFLSLFQSDRFLSAAQKERMFTPGEKPAPSDAYFSSAYGFGWGIQTLLDGRTRIYHGGDGIAHGSGFSWYPNDDLLVISLTNIRHDWFPTTVRADRIPALVILGKKYIDPPNFSEIAYDPSPILGLYRLPSGGSVSVWKSEYGLQLGAAGQDAVDLIDPAPAERREERAKLDRDSEAAFTKLMQGNHDALKDFGAGPDFGKGAAEEIRTYEPRLGKFESLSSSGTGTGGFSQYCQILHLRFARGEVPYKVQYQGRHLDATWLESPRFASPIRLQPITARRWVAWNLVTRKATRIELTGRDHLRVEGPEGASEAVRTRPTQVQ